MLPKKKKEGKGLFDHLKKEKKGLFLYLKKESRDHEWARVKREILDPYFIANGLYNICELKLPNICQGSFKLSYAHSKKRGDIALKEPKRTKELTEVVRACPKCHHEIEYPKKEILPEGISGREYMRRIVVDCIERRNKRLSRLEKMS